MKLPKRPRRSTSPFSFLASVGCQIRSPTRHTVHLQTAGTESAETTTTTCTKHFGDHR